MPSQEETRNGIQTSSVDFEILLLWWKRDERFAEVLLNVSAIVVNPQDRE
jgi:hypothetical protein